MRNYKKLELKSKRFLKLKSFWILLLVLSGCKFPDIKAKFVDLENNNVRVFYSPENYGGEWEDSGIDLPVDSLQDHFCFSPEDFQKLNRFYQRQCSEN